MARHKGDRKSERRSAEIEQVTFSGERSLIRFGDSIGITLPKTALGWTLEDTDIVGEDCTVRLYADGTYEIDLPTQ